MKHAIVAGTFEIGERVREEQFQAIARANVLGGDVVILVNDIGLAQKLLAYELGDTDAINALYAERLLCAKTGCQISQLPKTKEEVALFRDDAALRTMLKVLRAYTDSCDFSDVQRVCQNVIVPEQIRERIRLYGVDAQQVRIYTERHLRNQVSRALRIRYAHQPQSLVPFIRRAQERHQGVALLLEELQSARRIPTCRAIVLQLYINLSQEYSSVLILQESLHQLAFENAGELYTQLHRVFPHDSRFQLTIQYQTL